MSQRPNVPSEIEEGWRDLANLSPDANPFFAPTVLRSALDTLAATSVAILAPTGETGRLAALAPVAAMRLGRIAPAVGVWTHLYGPLGTPLIDPDDPEFAVARLVAAMDGKRSGRRILVFPDLPLGGVAAEALRRHAEASGRPVRIIGEHRRAVLHPGSLEGGVRASLPAKTRKELGRQLRRLGDSGSVTFSTVTAGPGLMVALDAFLALEQSGWKGTRGTALAMKGEALAFVRAVVAAAEPGQIRIDTLAVDGRPAAMLTSFRSGGTMVTWKIAHDESLGRFSPGVQVMLAASEAFTADPALKIVDSLASAGHPMIDRLWPERQAVGTLTIGPIGGGRFFSLGVLLAETELGARTDLRALIRRS
ncbi:GNAT family N-acetyltransferase [Kaistia soli]|uniref:GNAT family N-acetyltransferase n=1 Tax=Kaistia soli TaxID=446684 RepID=UPI00093296EE|nr:GNAT family N-acetyltransferase [Kaistia soli]